MGFEISTIVFWGVGAFALFTILKMLWEMTQKKTEAPKVGETTAKTEEKKE